MDRVPSVSLGLDDVPQLAVGTGQRADIGGLASTLREDDCVVQDDLDERRGRGGSRLLLLSLSAIGWNRRRLRNSAGDGGRGELAQERVALRKGPTIDGSLFSLAATMIGVEQA